MPLPRRALLARVEDALPVHVVLLLDLPQDGRRRRLRHQHHGRGRQPQGARTHRRLSRHARRRRAALLRRSADRRCGCGTSDGRSGCIPFASAIDTPLPRPKERSLIFLGSRAKWAHVPRRAGASRPIRARPSSTGTRGADCSSRDGISRAPGSASAHRRHRLRRAACRASLLRRVDAPAATPQARRRHVLSAHQRASCCWPLRRHASSR